MVSPDSALRRLLRDTGKLLQPYGFDGSEPSWVRVEPDGVASIGRTRVSRTWTAGQQVLGFGLHLNATPRSWWEFSNWRNARLGLSATPLQKATGPGLVETNGLSDELTTAWSVRTDPAQPGQHVLQADIEAIRAQLPRRIHAYARRAIRLLEPDHYLDELLAQPNPELRTCEAIVVLLADRGPGPELEAAIDQLRECSAAQDASAFADDAITYAHARAALT